MTDLSENLSDLTAIEAGNTDTQQVLTIAGIDAINEALAETESTVAENTTVEPVNNSDRLETDAGAVAKNATTELSGNSEQLETDFEIPEPYVCPWADAPENTIYYEKIYEDGHLGSSTESAEMAYKLGWYENRISNDDVKQSDINGWVYVKDKCPMKTAEDISRDEAKARIFELKNFLAATDYRAIKFAEGALTAEEYEPDRQARADARAEINRLEASL